MKFLSLTTNTIFKATVIALAIGAVILGANYVWDNNIELASERMQKSIDTYVESVETDHYENIQKTINTPENENSTVSNNKEIEDKNAIIE